MAEEPTIELIIEKGPREGETLTFLCTQPPIRIGRVVRGNSVPIKDSGISTKHLTIEFKPDQWVITDIGSSNGTILNSSVLEPLSPTALSDGDIVKIGEVTVIRVRIGVPGVVKQNPSRRGKGSSAVELPEMERRGRTRREKAVEEVLVKVDVIRDEAKLGFSEEKKTRGRTKTVKVAEENSVNEGGVEDNTELRFGDDVAKKTRGGRKKENAGPIEQIQGRQFSPRRTRSKKNENNSSVDDIRNDEVGVAAEMLDKKTRGGGRKRGKVTAQEAAKSSPLKVVPQVSTRRTRRTKIEESLCLRENENGQNEDAGNSQIGDKATKKGKKGKGINEQIGTGEGGCSEKGNTVIVQSGDGLSLEKFVVKSEPRESFCEVENNEKVKNLGTSTEERQNRDSDLSNLGQECAKKSDSRGEEAPDLEKMTLGEWFDYLDVYLPKSIYDKTEEIIAEMYVKAERFREFVREHEKDKEKGKLPLI